MIERIAVFGVLQAYLELSVSGETEDKIEETCEYIAKRMGIVFLYFKEQS